MDRTEFFKIAQKVAVYTNKCKDLSKPTLQDCIVVHNGIKYYPQYVQVGYDENGAVENIALLHDLEADCIAYANLEMVKRLNE